MWVSRAKWLAVAASPRYEPWRSGASAGRKRWRWLGTSYGVRRPEPPELKLRASQAISLPSAATALRMSITPAGRK